ncbi:hypothetical protein FLP10_05895 [Agromyces intestinalis]|uniref:Signal peptidase I n=1 Tax=Agromyces intestinalis TaxID=2592652 RepID=A0A5C1YD82_9MICO|nr:DUF5684 domain-containing protein [Agromyces intestinalis]QEO14006.1 hypothetical protein FLP10_05895 [Agromyces intestinalis]
MTHLAATDALAASIGMFVVIWALIGLILVATYVATGVLLSKVFQATGQPGWPAWVPLYSSWRLLELGGQQGWIALLSFVPGANIVAVVFLIMAVHKVNEGFGKGVGHTVLYVFLPLVWMALIGFGGSPWRGLQPPAGGYPQPVPAYLPPVAQPAQPFPPQTYQAPPVPPA